MQRLSSWKFGSLDVPRFLPFFEVTFLIFVIIEVAPLMEASGGCCSSLFGEGNNVIRNRHSFYFKFKLRLL
jgi:hypothetical protein